MFYINYFGEGNGNPLQCFLPGEFHGWSSLVGYSPSGHEESDMTQHTHTHTLCLASWSGLWRQSWKLAFPWHWRTGCCHFSVAKSCPTLWEPMSCSTPGFPVTISPSLLKLMSIQSVMPSNHLILCRPLLLLPSIFSGSGEVSSMTHKLYIPDLIVGTPVNNNPEAHAWHVLDKCVLSVELQ